MHQTFTIAFTKQLSQHGLVLRCCDPHVLPTGMSWDDWQSVAYSGPAFLWCMQVASDKQGHTFSPLEPGILLAHFYIRCLIVMTLHADRTTEIMSSAGCQHCRS